MKELLINLPIESYSVKGNVISETGEIFVQVDDCFFPSKNWTDFGRVIIFWWAQSITKLLSGNEIRVKCDFMDGSYRFDIEKTDSSDIWHIYFIKETPDSEDIELEFDTNAKQFTDEVLTKIETIQDKLKILQNDDGVQRVKNFRDEYIRLKEEYFSELKFKDK
jgi:hypothetical protein